MSDDKLIFNGISGVTGEYLIPPMTLAEATSVARGASLPKNHLKSLGDAADRIAQKPFALPLGTDQNDLTQSGWGVVFAPGTPATIRKALDPLLKKRKKDASTLYKELEYQAGESREAFLNRYGASGSDVEPDKVPFYLLLVGDPTGIPFDVQFLLDVDYAVGRLAFDNVEDYGRYAKAVVGYEKSKTVENGRNVVFWGTEHDSDEATELSSEFLIRPLFEGIPKDGVKPKKLPMTDKFKFRSTCFRGEDATKATLLETIHAKKRPSVLFTASHGIGFPAGHARQISTQGALLCQDWPGFGSMKPEHYLAATDIDAKANLSGTIAFVFACYGAGTPQHDPFLTKPKDGPLEVAKAPFISALSQRLLSSGALAVIGHVERAWTYSIKPSSVGPQLQPFNNLIGRIISGERVGNAPLDFNQRYATESVNLTRLLDPSLPAAKLATDSELVSSWIRRNDAQNYVVLGDPAVCLRTSDLV